MQPTKSRPNIKQELAALDTTLLSLAQETCLDVFALDETMLNRATQLYTAGIAAKPFDQAILAGVLVRATQLWNAGQRRLSFCQTDSDLQPWDKYGNPKPPLRDLYRQAHTWVYGDFTLTQPERPEDFL